MSFPRRLTMFFLLIVVIPMVAVGVLVVEVTEDSRRGKADARLAPALETAAALASERLSAGARVARAAANDPQLAQALATGDRAAARGAAARLVRAHGARFLAIADGGGEILADAGSDEPVAVAAVTVNGPDDTLGEVTASAVSAPAFLTELERATGSEGALFSQSGEVVASSVPVAGFSPPTPGEAVDLEVDGEEMRVAAANLPGDRGIRVALLAPFEQGGFFDSRPAIGAALAGFFALALALVVLVSKGLQAQIAERLAAAQRIGSGELAAVARELSKIRRRARGPAAHRTKGLSDRARQPGEQGRDRDGEAEGGARDDAGDRAATAGERSQEPGGHPGQAIERDPRGAREQDVSEGVRVIVLAMSAAGSSRAQIKQHLSEDVGVSDPDRVLEEVFGPP